jgi:hypothetical protein
MQMCSRKLNRSSLSDMDLVYQTIRLLLDLAWKVIAGHAQVRQ